MGGSRRPQKGLALERFSSFSRSSWLMRNEPVCVEGTVPLHLPMGQEWRPGVEVGRAAWEGGYGDGRRKNVPMEPSAEKESMQAALSWQGHRVHGSDRGRERDWGSVPWSACLLIPE